MVAGALADHPLRHLLDDGGDTRRAEALVELAPADDAVLGGQLDEVIVPPAGVAVQRLDLGDLHGLLLPISCRAATISPIACDRQSPPPMRRSSEGVRHTSERGRSDRPFLSSGSVRPFL